MAKKQTFGDKTSKGKKLNTKVKLIRAKTTDKNSLSFSEEMVSIPDGKQADAVLKELVSSK